MNIDNLTYGELKQIAAMFQPQTRAQTRAQSDTHWEIGRVYLIRTVTHIDTGRLVAVTPHELVVEDAAWIADTGRFADAIAKAEFGEVEPYPDGIVIIGRGALIDAVKISKTQRVQK
jgi:hypothetical protein